MVSSTITSTGERFLPVNDSSTSDRRSRDLIEQVF